MNRVSTGQVYVADRVFKGQSAHGKYEIIGVNDNNGKNEMTMFVNDKCIPSGIEKGDKFRINAITEASRSWKKDMVYDRETKQKKEAWVEKFSINVDVVRIARDFDGVDVPDPADEFGGALPWEEDELPL